ncbi:hypothetical protein WG907_01385 [Sphingobium sp. AN558]|uniref:hypothetical protein n=1 Tax=Sphingobium sp. AN558 TaxID=3133442 RepID=UPI0030C577B3
MRFLSLTLSMTLATPLLLLLSSCVGPAPQAPHSSTAPPPAPRRPVPAPAAAMPAPVPLATEWQYRPATPGNWTYRAESAGSVALFGPGAGDARFSIRCDRAGGRMTFARPGGVGQGAMTIRTSGGAANWPVTPAAGAAATVAIRAASDAMLDQIAYSRGRFMVEVAGLEPLYLPAWGEVSRVIEDCRG